MPGTAVNVTDVPVQMFVPGFAPTVTVGATIKLTVTSKLLGTPLKQLFVGVTVTLPELAVPQFTVMFVVPCPVAIDAPAGTDQLYPVAPLTAAIAYGTPGAFEQTPLAPAIAPATAGGPVTVTSKLTGEPLKQLLVGVTVTGPVPAVNQFTVMFVVPCPVAINAPAGTDQLYPVAPLTAAIAYGTPGAFEHTVLAPVIVPAPAGALVTVTVRLLAPPLTQLFVGVTVTGPVLAVPQFTVMFVVPCPSAIDAPAGTLQL